ncbi:general secretion pathway protein GspB [Shewanella avicenniae]|uniref:General secretion pathway protein GspB n=1 Tax=Shewanella avicenniae TaxID=2814294 RepID=A0ABX7QVL9_9GAMM|nr:general secretion pathway protein GspB [Shewanella avicenniae]QSX34673.1 general secretion pathway protein GspB [Shewanella avicenniae]
MSILLDAVSRSKQELNDGEFDPITAPRPVLPQQRSYTALLVIIASLLVLLLIALGIFTWFNLNHKATADMHSTPVAAVTANKPEVAIAVPAQTASVPTQTASAAQTPAVALAGKVTLPRPRQLPVEAPVQQSTTVVESATSPADTRLTAVATPEVAEPVTADEPIMLGANANEKGLAMLRQLQAPPQAATPVAKAPAEAPAVNDELMDRFQAALSEIEKRNSMNNDTQPVDQAQSATPVNYPSYGELPAGLQLQVPEFNINAHLYATNPQKRWINVDGKELQQGDKIKQKLTVVEIRPNDVVLAIQGTRFRVPAI